MGGEPKQKNNPKGFNIRNLPKCQAIAKHAGRRCRQIAMKGKRVCYYHGGKSTGPPRGSQNALKQGLYTREAMEQRRQVREILTLCSKTIEQIDKKATE